MNDLSTEEQELCRQLKGHPIPCASGDCSSPLEHLQLLLFTESDNETDKSHLQTNSKFMQAVTPGLEAKLQVQHAPVITQFEQEVRDDPEYGCCSCERLHQRKAVTSMKLRTKSFHHQCDNS